jgi:hypothetical protein
LACAAALPLLAMPIVTARAATKQGTLGKLMRWRFYSRQTSIRYRP